ncbi:MAG: transposase [Planctomycetes bacterium]|nr:transposase [Planctomycetota bacterium]
MTDPVIPATLLALLTPFAGSFSRPSFENFQTLVVGWILCPGRHTITRVIEAAAGMTRRPKHHTAFYRFFSRSAWSADALGMILLDRLLPCCGGELILIGSYPAR